jgi:hypothetical protein
MTKDLHIQSIDPYRDRGKPRASARADVRMTKDLHIQSIDPYRDRGKPRASARAGVTMKESSDGRSTNQNRDRKGADLAIAEKPRGAETRRPDVSRRRDDLDLKR